jgi:hypothetical protein
MALSFTADQWLAMERNTFCARVQRFIGLACHRDDFKAWARKAPHVEALWWPLWPHCRQHSAHDLALAMVTLAAAAHQGIDLGGSLPVLQQVATNEVRLKNWLVERGYFNFTAFDSDMAR